MMIAPNSHDRKGRMKKEEVKEEYWRIREAEEVNADYGGMVQPSQQYVTPCVKVVEWGLDTRGLTMLAAF